ncbi:MAG: response regulator [Flavobacteriales bacterium]|nr:MAG: response regulator [Flavobacteriales bacterium]
MSYKKKILICDDDPGIMDLMEVILVDSGYEVFAASNSLLVKALIEKETPDLVILDLWMPVLSGDLVLQLIRQMPERSELPVVAISAGRDAKRIATEAGANAFVAKPFDIDHFLAIVSQSLHLEAVLRDANVIN